MPMCIKKDNTECNFILKHIRKSCNREFCRILSIGLILCVTIVGIPFGLQQFKLAKLALMPFGAEVY